MTRGYGLLCTLVLILPAGGCSWDDLKHTGYETLESVSRQQCLDDPERDCPAERTRYEDYQKDRERLQREEP